MRPLARLEYDPRDDVYLARTRTGIGTWQTVLDEQGRTIDFSDDCMESDQRGLRILYCLEKAARL